jgi:hypothetical protein
MLMTLLLQKIERGYAGAASEKGINQMKSCLICSTLSMRGKHQLLLDGRVAYEFPTEIELSQKARSLGINFRNLVYEVQPSNSEIALTHWYGPETLVQYLNWKGTLGPGLKAREVIKKENEG